jgi:hypothetical protein
VPSMRLDDATRGRFAKHPLPEAAPGHARPGQHRLHDHQLPVGTLGSGLAGLGWATVVWAAKCLLGAAIAVCAVALWVSNSRAVSARESAAGVGLGRRVLAASQPLAATARLPKTRSPDPLPAATLVGRRQEEAQ